MPPQPDEVASIIIERQPMLAIGLACLSDMQYDCVMRLVRDSLIDYALRTRRDVTNLNASNDASTISGE